MSTPSPRPSFQHRPPPRKRSPKLLLALAATALIVALIWFFVLRTPSSDYKVDTQVAQTQLQRFEGERLLMGTLFSIVVYSPNKTKASSAMAAAFDRAAEIEKICSDYDSTSELSKLTSAEIGEAIPISDTLTTVLAHARLMAEVTDGSFDPTLGPLTKLWRKSRTKKTLPETKALYEAQTRTGWRDLTVDLTSKTVTLHREGMSLDLGGIAKGYAADEMFQILLNQGHSSAIIAAGGDLRLGNPPPGEQYWRVALVTLSKDSNETIQVANCAVSTSGDLNNFVEIDGKRYSHILDPTTGFGLTRQIAATIVAPTATQSDPYATFACLNPSRAFQSFNAGEISVRIVTKENERIRDQQSLNFPEILNP